MAYAPEVFHRCGPVETTGCRQIGFCDHNNVGRMEYGRIFQRLFLAFGY